MIEKIFAPFIILLKVLNLVFIYPVKIFCQVLYQIGLIIAYAVLAACSLMLCGSVLFIVLMILVYVSGGW